MADEKKTAIKTTIVGGQPPGNERALDGSVSVGIEELLSMAAADEEFAGALLERREEALEASGVPLTASERAILGTVTPAALEQMIAGVRAMLPEPERREFLGRSAAAMLLLLGSGAAASGAGCNRSVTGSRPEPIPAPPQTTTGSRPDRPEEITPPRPDMGVAEPPPLPPTGHRPDLPPKSRGISPDRPRPDEHGFGSPKTGSRPDEPEPKPKPDAGRPRPPTRPRPTRGIRPDYPPAKPTWTTPDQPKEEK